MTEEQDNEGHWDLFVRPTKDGPAFITVNLSRVDSVPDEAQPWLLHVTVPLLEPREDGLPTDVEFGRLGAIEEQLVPVVTETLQGEYVGRLTSGGRRGWIFYAKEEEGLDEIISQLGQHYADYTFENGSSRDPEWRYYIDVLTPTRLEQQQMSNRDVIEALQEHGDSLTRSRAVSHWTCFPTAESREAFIEVARARGYTAEIEDDDEAEDGDSSSFGASLEKVHAVDWETVNGVTTELLELTEEHGGDYDGWETSVEDG